jgi:hypothetical protein
VTLTPMSIWLQRSVEMVRDFGVGGNSTVSESCHGIEARMVKEKKLRDRIEKIVASINQLYT